MGKFDQINKWSKIVSNRTWETYIFKIELGTETNAIFWSVGAHCIYVLTEFSFFHLLHIFIIIIFSEKNSLQVGPSGHSSVQQDDRRKGTLAKQHDEDFQ